MAIISNRFLGYLSNVLTNSMNTKKHAYVCDYLFALIEKGRGSSVEFSNCTISDKQADEAQEAYAKSGVAGVINSFLKEGIIDQFVDVETERQVVALKKGYSTLPATTAAVIMQGFGKTLKAEGVRVIYASHGLAQGMKELAEEFDFTVINRRVKEFSVVVNDVDRFETFKRRYETMRQYIQSDSGNREAIIRESGINRSIFFHYWERFKRYGLIGLVDAGKEVFRQSKVGLDNEARIVIDKLQHPEKKNVDYVQVLKTKGIDVGPSTVSKMFTRWKTSSFDSKFTDNLKRFETGFADETRVDLVPVESPVRYVDSYYLNTLRGIKEYGIPTDSPGLFLIWTYIERLGIFPVLESMNLNNPETVKGYSWLDLLLLNIGRIFYGIPSYSATCEHPEPSVAFFAGLVRPPCNDTFLNGLEGKITEKQVYTLRQWLVTRACELELIDLKQTALDFHQIDLDVQLGKLRKFGKGPSPKKKVCYNGFRPHIAWDVGTGCLIAAEFRKGSARGTTTAVPFMKDFIPPELREHCETIYIDSEYTGRDLWNFILGPNGMNAHMTACLKQNPFVRKHRDLFLQAHQNEPDFWSYYDDNHVYSARTFDLTWEYRQGESTHPFTLHCIVKKNINNGKLRCFGTSQQVSESGAILEDYTKRWVIENGIKDLIGSYYFDNCPGTRPHLADVHFLIITICRMLYKMIENDMGEHIRNADGTARTLGRMRSMLFRQGAGMIRFRDRTFDIEFQNSYSPQMTGILNDLFKSIGADQGQEFALLGGAKLKFSMKIPFGEEHRNSLEKEPLSRAKNF